LVGEEKKGGKKENVAKSFSLYSANMTHALNACRLLHQYVVS